MTRRSRAGGAPGPSLTRNLRWGVAWGAFYAALCSAWVLVGRALDGGQAVARHGTTAVRVVALYWLIGPGAGATAGLLRPLSRTRLGSAAVGWLVGAVVYGGIGLAQDGPTPQVAGLAAALGLLVGVPCALVAWRRSAVGPA